MDPLVTAEAFAAYLQHDVDRYTAELALAGASGLVRHYCGWVISEEETTFTADGNDCNTLSLPTLRLTAVDAVRIDGDAVTDFEYSRNGQLRRTGGWPRRFRAIEADVTHGYDPIPDEIGVVVMALASRYYNNPQGLRSKTVGSVSRVFVIESMKGDLTELETVLIGGHRLP